MIIQTSKRKDKFSKEKRSQIMSRIRSKNTSLDLAMRGLLRNARLRFRSYPEIFGNPDFLVDDHVAVFCDSSFWHGREWRKLKSQLEQGSRATYWIRHISENRKRDRLVTLTLEKSGYTVVRFWDSDISARAEDCIQKLVEVANMRNDDSRQSRRVLT
jgi:DNA mismatch endonuclease (patch repair protein)